MDPWFIITQKARTMTIEWRIPNVTSLSHFIYWALTYHAQYQIRAATKKGIVELVPITGAAGEYHDGLFCPLPVYATQHCYPYRTNFGSTHKLLQHGLDALPTAFQRQLFHQHSNDQLFLVITKHDAFTLSPTEWSHHLSRPQDGPLYTLALQIVRTPKTTTEEA